MSVGREGKARLQRHGGPGHPPPIHSSGTSWSLHLRVQGAGSKPTYQQTLPGWYQLVPSKALEQSRGKVGTGLPPPSPLPQGRNKECVTFCSLLSEAACNTRGTPARAPETGPRPRRHGPKISLSQVHSEEAWPRLP